MNDDDHNNKASEHFFRFQSTVPHAMMRLRLSTVTWILFTPSCRAFFLTPTVSFGSYQRQLYSTTTTTSSPVDSQGPIANAMPRDFAPPFLAATNATQLKRANTNNRAHDNFRYEWGTWCGEDSIEHLMDRVDEVRLNQGVYDAIMGAQDDNTEIQPEVVRFRVASDKDWDCILYFLPLDATWRRQRPSGS
jgi:hypothetical protein